MSKEVEENQIQKSEKSKEGLPKEVVDFKGTRQGLLILLDGQEDFKVIKKRLKEKFETSRDFFTRSEVIVDIGDRVLTNEETRELARLIREECGLRCRRIGDKIVDDVEDEEEGANQPEKELETLLIKRTIRSGQRLYHDGNIVILGDVNPGAEVVATGDIIIIGTFRGVAHAGAGGNEDAIIVATSLRPTQIRIADFITRAPDDERYGAANLTEIARIKGGYVVIEAYTSGVSLL